MSEHPRSFAWPVRLERSGEGDEILVSCRDLPEVITAGRTEAEALDQAEDALVVAIGGRMKDGMDIPVPSAPIEGEVAVPLPAPFAAKLAVWSAWRASRVSKVALAARLGLDEGEVRRILDPSHNTKLDRLDKAARALGVRLIVEAVAA